MWCGRKNGLEVSSLLLVECRSLPVTIDNSGIPNFNAGLGWIAARGFVAGETIVQYHRTWYAVFC